MHVNCEEMKLNEDTNAEEEVMMKRKMMMIKIMVIMKKVWIRPYYQNVR